MRLNRRFIVLVDSLAMGELLGIVYLACLLVFPSALLCVAIDSVAHMPYVFLHHWHALHSLTLSLAHDLQAILIVLVFPPDQVCFFFHDQ